MKTDYNIIVIGDVMLDVYEFYNSIKLSPEAPVPVISYNKTKYCLGGAANVAAHFVKNNLEVLLISQISNDESGKKIQEICDENDIKCDFYISEKIITTSKKRIISDNYQMVRIDSDCNSKMKGVCDKLKKYNINKNSYILLSDYNKGVINANESKAIITYAKSKGAYIAVDTKKTDISIFANADIITPNRSEFSNIMGINSKNSIEDNARKLINQFNIGSFLITLSEKGLQYIDNKQNINSPTEATNVLDVTGAGDTVFAFWIISKLKALKTRETLKFCNLAASIAVKQLGTYIVLINQINKKPTSKLIDIDCLSTISKIKKEEGKKIVGTNGCFDLLHAGHIDSIKYSSEQGDILFVGLNSDESIAEMKGSKRPVVSFQERLDILSSIKYIDYIVQIGQSPLEFYTRLLPDVLVKGEEYSGKNVIGSDEVVNSGGRVLMAPQIRNISTSILIKKIKNT